MSVEAAKEALRREVLARRDALTPEQRAALSRPINEALLGLPAVQEAGCLLVYACFRTEVMTHDFIAGLAGQGKCLLLPKVHNSSRTLRLYEIVDRDVDTAPGVWQISEPLPERCRLASPDEVDFALVPGVAFDAHGHRLGYGGGFYDGLLAHLAPCLAPECIVAPAFELQIVPEVPTAPRDLPVPTIITEERTIRAQP
jgi:5-formyltetrahydrofolate cyclo-ligase